MTDGADLMELADRCEKATGPDRALDLRIAAAVDPDYDGLDEAHASFLTKYGGHPNFTASLDAAMSLVPEGIRRLIETQECLREGEVRGWARVDVMPVPHSLSLRGEGHAATPALALCAAALRALAAQEPSS